MQTMNKGMSLTDTVLCTDCLYLSTPLLFATPCHVNRRRNLVTGYTKYNTYTPITQLNQLNYDTWCSLETSIKLTRVTRGFEPRYRGSARAGQTTEPSAGRKPAARAKRQDMNVSNHCRRMISVLQRHRRGAGAGAAERSAAAGAGRHARKTAKAPVLMVEAWARTPSIGRTGMLRPVCGVARSAPADAACLGSGSATRTLVHACIGRLSVVAGTARARWLR